MEFRWGRGSYLASVIFPLFEHVYGIIDLPYASLRSSLRPEAICEAVRRPTMRFVRVKSGEQQGQLMLLRTRDLLMRQRTQVIKPFRVAAVALANKMARIAWALLAKGGTYRLVLAIARYGPSPIHGAEEGIHAEGIFLLLSHDLLPFPVPVTVTM
jgi:hypothetical protein